MKKPEKTASVYLIGFVASAMSCQTMILVGDKCEHFIYLIFVFAITVFAYNFTSGNKAIKTQAYIFLIIALTFLPKFNRITLIYIIILFAVSSLYYFLPAGHSIRVKTFLKPLLIATIWVLITVTLPYEIINDWHNASNVMNIKFMAFERFFFFFASTLAYDIVDTESDKKAGLITIPLKYDKTTALLIISFSLTLAAVFAGVNLLQNFYRLYVFSAILLSLIIAAFTIRKILIANNTYSAKLVIDLMFIVQFTLVLAAVNL